MTTYFNDLQDVKIHPLILMNFMLFVQTLDFFSVFCGPLFVLFWSFYVPATKWLRHVSVTHVRNSEIKQFLTLFFAMF